MEIIKLVGGSLSIHLDEAEKELLNGLAQDLLVKLKNEDPQASIPRLFPSAILNQPCLLYTSPSPRDISGSRMPSSA